MAPRRHPPRLAVPQSHLQRSQTPTGSGTFNNLLVHGTANIGGSMVVGGAVTFVSTLAVGGAVSLSSTLDVTGAATFTSTVRAAEFLGPTWDSGANVDAVIQRNNVTQLTLASSLATFVGDIAVGTGTVATTGRVRLANNSTGIQFRNAANTANIPALVVDNTNTTIIDSGTGGGIILRNIGFPFVTFSGATATFATSIGAVFATTGGYVQFGNTLAAGLGRIRTRNNDLIIGSMTAAGGNASILQFSSGDETLLFGTQGIRMGVAPAGAKYWLIDADNNLSSNSPAYVFTVGGSTLTRANISATATFPTAGVGVGARLYGQRITVSSSSPGLGSVSTYALTLSASAAGSPVEAIALDVLAGDTRLQTVTQGLWNGTAVGATYGGTGLTSYLPGDILYASAANTLTTLAGNTTATKKYLTMTGTGAGVNPPVWDTLAIAPSDLTGYGAAGGYLRSDGSAWVRVSGLDVADLTGTTLPASIVTSSLTTIGTLVAGAVPASLVTAGTFGAGAYGITGTGTTPLVLTRTGSGNNVSIQAVNSDGSLYFGMDSNEAFAVAGIADLAASPWFRVNSAGAIVAGTYNAQTISSAASFTGTVSAVTSFTAPLLAGTTRVTSPKLGTTTNADVVLDRNSVVHITLQTALALSYGSAADASGYSQTFARDLTTASSIGGRWFTTNGGVATEAMRFTRDDLLMYRRFNVQDAAGIVLRLQNTAGTVDVRQWDHRISSAGAYELRSVTDGGSTVFHALSVAHATGDVTMNALLTGTRIYATQSVAAGTASSFTAKNSAGADVSNRAAYTWEANSTTQNREAFRITAGFSTITDATRTTSASLQGQDAGVFSTFLSFLGKNATFGGSVTLTGALAGVTTGAFSGQITSTVAGGTAPFSITSTTVVTNLNADLLDGQHGSYYNDAANLTGVVTETHGGTNQSTYTLGDLLYASAANTLSKLAGNITTTRKFLRQVGNGSVSAAPAWDTLTAADVGVGTFPNGIFTMQTLSATSVAATNIQISGGGSFTWTSALVMSPAIVDNGLTIKGSLASAGGFIRLTGNSTVATGAYIDLFGTSHANAGRLDIVSGGTADLNLTAGSGIVKSASDFQVASGKVYKVNGTQVVKARITGYTNAMTGTADRATSYDTSTITLQQLAERVKALEDDLITHGLIGA